MTNHYYILLAVYKTSHLSFFNQIFALTILGEFESLGFTIPGSNIMGGDN